MRITLQTRCFLPVLLVAGGLFGCVQGGDEVGSADNSVESTLEETDTTEPATEPETTAPGAAKRPGDPCVPSDVLLEGAPEGAECHGATSYPYGYWSWPCISDEDCGAGNRCAGEECVRPCSDDSECKAPMTCVKQVGDAEIEIPTCICLAEECQDPGDGPQPAVDAAE